MIYLIECKYESTTADKDNKINKKLIFSYL